MKTLKEICGVTLTLTGPFVPAVVGWGSGIPVLRDAGMVVGSVWVGILLFGTGIAMVGGIKK